MERISTKTSREWSAVDAKKSIRPIQLENRAQIDVNLASSSPPQQGEGSTDSDVQCVKPSHDDLPPRLGSYCRRERTVLPNRLHIRSQYNSYVTINNGDHNKTNNGIGSDRRRRYKLGGRSRVVRRLKRRRQTRKAFWARPSLKDLLVIALSVTSLYKSSSFGTIILRKGRFNRVECHGGTAFVCRTHAAHACALNFAFGGPLATLQTDSLRFLAVSPLHYIKPTPNISSLYSLLSRKG